MIEHHTAVQVNNGWMDGWKDGRKIHRELYIQMVEPVVSQNLGS